MDDLKKVSLIFLGLIALWVIIALVRKPPTPTITFNQGAVTAPVRGTTPEPVLLDDLPEDYAPPKQSSSLFGNFFSMSLGDALSSFTSQSNGSGPTSISSADPELYTEQLSEEEIKQELARAQELAEEIEQRIKELEEEQLRSPYFGLISIARGGATASHPQSEHVTLNVSKNLDERISVTDWSLYSEITGARVTLPEATNLPVTTGTSIRGNLFVSGGERIFVVTGISPLGSSFRINSCIGYLSQTLSFTPRLPNSCPDPVLNMELKTVSNPNGFTRECIDFVDRIGRCQTPELPLPLSLRGSCEEYIVDTTNYTSCVDDHRNDDDFYKNEWRIYLGRGEEVWDNRDDLIVLYDSNGLVVDTISY